MAESDTVAIMIALISAGMSAFATVLTLYITRKNLDITDKHNKELAILQTNLNKETTVLQDQLNRQSERDLQLDKLINQYLFQLQDATEILWGRLDSVRNLGGRLIMDDPYYETSTLYALASVLAYNRIMLLDGVYPQIEALRPAVGNSLKKKLQDFEFFLDKGSPGLPRYHRLALAEMVMERVKDRLLVCTYLEFNKRYEKRETEEAALPAKRLVSTLDCKEESEAKCRQLDELMEGILHAATIDA